MAMASVALTLFLVLDPFGNILPIWAMLKKVPAERRMRVLVRENLIALAVLLFFLFAGASLLSLLGVRQDALQISGGILLLLIAVGMVFPQRSMLHEADEGEPFIVPISVPLLAGPSVIALVLTYSTKHAGQLPALLAALLLAWGGTMAVLLAGGAIIRLLGDRGTRALERLMGLLLVLIAVQMLLDGIGPRFGGGSSDRPAPEAPAVK